jgi:choline-sulfatase
LPGLSGVRRPRRFRRGAAGALAALLSTAGVALAGCSRDLQTRPESPARESSAELPPPGAARDASLLLVTLDTTRADRIGAYGYEAAETPHIDRLATEGIRFVDAVSPVPMTLPAHASLLTGLDPPRHGVRANGELTLDAQLPTLATLLAARGYDTAAFVSSFVLDARFGLARGFATYDARLEASRAAAFGQQSERSAEAVTTAAIEWLDGRRDAARPFLLWVHYFDPHDPYDPPAPYRERFRERPYDGEIAHVDAQLGRLLARLERGGERARSIVLVTADHGESLGEHGERYHSRTLYEGAVRVPLLLTVPGFPGPRVEGERLASLVDVAPTLLDLLGLDVPPGLDGESLLRPPASAERRVYLETLNTYLDNGWAPLHALRGRREKYIRAPRPEYYDLARDPREQRNLAETSAASVAALEAELAERLSGTLDAAAVAAAATPADVELRARLQALGYLTGSGPERPVDPRALPDPKDALPLLEEYLAARAELAAGRPAEAAAGAVRLLRASPRDRSALQLLAEASAVAGRADEAERALRRSLEIGPTVPALVLLAQVLMPAGRFEEADALLAQATALDPRHGGVALARGDLALFHGRREEALRRYEEARTVDPFRFGGVVADRLARMGAPPSRPGGSER